MLHVNENILRVHVVNGSVEEGTLCTKKSPSSVALIYSMGKKNESRNAGEKLVPA